MKNLLILPIVVALFLGGGASAQTQADLPKAGITPENPFYFLDKLGEALQEFFTFNPEGKAKLQITFAAERVSEITVVLESKGVEAKGLDVAQSRLQAHLAKAAGIVNEEKGKGKDVSVLAQELGEKLKAPKAVLAEGFKEQKRELERQEDELKAQLKEAHRAGDVSQEEAIAAQLGQVKAQLELLELREDDIEEEIEAEEERIEEEMEAQHQAQEAIEEAEEEKQEALDEAAEEGVELPANAFAEFDNLLSQAQAAFEAGNFQEARQLAKQAEDVAEDLEEVVEDLEEEMEQSEDAKEAIEEAEEELEKIQAEAQAGGIAIPPEVLAEYTVLISQAKNAFAAKNYTEAKQLAEQAEDALENVEEAIEQLEEEKEQEGEEEDEGEEGEQEEDNL